MRSPKQVVEAWVQAFNRADHETIATYYHEDAVNHQVMFAPVKGQQSIRQMFQREFASADMNCIVENLFSDGEWAILEWRDPQGLRGCGFFHVVNEKIKFQRGYWDRQMFHDLHGKNLK